VGAVLGLLDKMPNLILMTVMVVMVEQVKQLLFLGHLRTMLAVAVAVAILDTVLLVMVALVVGVMELILRALQVVLELQILAEVEEGRLGKLVES